MCYLIGRLWLIVTPEASGSLCIGLVTTLTIIIIVTVSLVQALTLTLIATVAQNPALNPGPGRPRRA